MGIGNATHEENFTRFSICLNLQSDVQQLFIPELLYGCYKCVDNGGNINEEDSWKITSRFKSFFGYQKAENFFPMPQAASLVAQLPFAVRYAILALDCMFLCPLLIG